MEFLLELGIIFCPIHIIYKLFIRIKYKKPFNKWDLIFLTFCSLFVAILIVMDMISDYTLGFIHAFKIVLCGVFALIVPSIIVQKIINFFSS